MLKPLYGLDCRGLLCTAAAGVLGAKLPKSFALADYSPSDKRVGFGKAESVLIVLLSSGPSQRDLLCSIAKTATRPNHFWECPV